MIRQNQSANIFLAPRVAVPSCCIVLVDGDRRERQVDSVGACPLHDPLVRKAKDTAYGCGFCSNLECLLGLVERESDHTCANPVVVLLPHNMFAAVCLLQDYELKHLKNLELNSQNTKSDCSV